MRIARIVSGLLFVTAIFCGVGPGVFWVAPEAAADDTTTRWLGLPILYTWSAFWCVLAGAALIPFALGGEDRTEAAEHEAQEKESPP